MSWFRESRRWLILSLLLASLLLICIGVLYDQHRSSARGGSVATYEPAPVASPEYLDVVILGDSYTVGIGSGLGMGFSQQVSRKLCWAVAMEGQTDTGYVAEGGKLGLSPFPARVPSVIDEEPDLIVVQGGISDIGRDGVEEAADRTFRELHQQSPQTPVIVVGPSLPRVANFADMAVVRDSIERASLRNGLLFIDPLKEGWLSEERFYTADGVHPNDLGYEEFTGQFVKSLSRLGMQEFFSCGG